MTATRRLSLQACVVLALGIAALMMPERARAAQAGCTFCVSSCPVEPHSYCITNCPKYPEGSCVESSIQAPCYGAPRVDCNYPK